jgi:hypothetical protein
MKKRILILVTILFGITISCNNDDDSGSTTADLTLAINGLEDLGANFVYEGWIIVSGAPVSTGTFTSTDTGQTFAIESSILDAATRFVLSVEPAGETGTDADTPADTKLMAGDFSGDDAALTIETVGEFDASNSGKFFLRTPTDETGTNNGNDENGIWFGNAAMPPTPGFDLPTLNPGWKYEGWVIVDGVGPLSTGTFTAFDIPDDSSLFGGGENTGPQVPGEDFLLNAPSGFTFPLDVRGRTVVISVEPSPDNSPNPFLLKPLSGAAGQDTAPTNYDLDFSNASFPTGSVSR